MFKFNVLVEMILMIGIILVDVLVDKLNGKVKYWLMHGNISNAGFTWSCTCIRRLSILFDTTGKGKGDSVLV